MLGSAIYMANFFDSIDCITSSFYEFWSNWSKFMRMLIKYPCATGLRKRNFIVICIDNFYS